MASLRYYLFDRSDIRISRRAARHLTKIRPRDGLSAFETERLMKHVPSTPETNVPYTCPPDRTERSLPLRDRYIPLGYAHIYIQCSDIGIVSSYAVCGYKYMLSESFSKKNLASAQSRDYKMKIYRYIMAFDHPKQISFLLNYSSQLILFY